MATQNCAGEAASQPGEEPRLEPRLGRPCKHKDGYSNAAKVIRILENTFLQWRELKSVKNLPDDDAVARYLSDALPTPSLSTECSSFEPRCDLQSV